MSYWTKINKNLANLAPEVQKLLDDKKLHQFDAEWIGGLPKNKQLAAAMRTIEGEPVQPAKGRAKSVYSRGKVPA